ncbi:MAG: TIGR03905 family TSCPD domain-containing protein [Clostridia bacterium]|nr:TIGR03905 family TSCPD domain-containing protein [Clostridia bacterium]
MYLFKTTGTCSKQITFDVRHGKVMNINFQGGCHGNLKVLSQLFEGKDIDEVINTLEGTLCGNKGTSCTDQLAKALILYKKKASLK